MKVEREKALEHKQRMSRMVEDKENFLSKITAARSFIYEVRSFNQLMPSTERIVTFFSATLAWGNWAIKCIYGGSSTRGQQSVGIVHPWIPLFVVVLLYFLYVHHLYLPNWYCTCVIMQLVIGWGNGQALGSDLRTCTVPVRQKIQIGYWHFSVLSF